MLMFLLSLGVLLLAARMVGELARHLRQPEVLGELLAGLLLGPTIFGLIAPEAQAALFPQSGDGAKMFAGFSQLAVVLFLFIVGLEIELGQVRRNGRRSLAVGLLGMVIPAALGFAVAWWWPGLVGGGHCTALPFALFFAIAMAVSALPVIARTLTDLGQLQSDVGVVVISAAVLSDLVGWIAFAAVLGMTGGSTGHALPAGWAATSAVLFAVLMLTAVRWGLVGLLPLINARWSWPGGILGFCLGLALLAGSLTEWLGLHAIFGAFLAGAALAGNPHLRERTREVLNQFIGFFFAPLFFASIGLRVDLRNDLDIGLTAIVLAIACAGKLIGGTLGARLGGMPMNQSWAVGVALNSRGVMEIILGTLALEAGIIGKPLFIALVVTALATSLFASPMLLRLIGRGPAVQRG